MMMKHLRPHTKPLSLAIGSLAVGSLMIEPTNCDWFGRKKAVPKGPLSGCTVLVTGSSRGLGLEFSKQLRDQGATVIATCRSPERAAELNQLGVRVEALDTTDKKSVDQIVSKLTSEGAVIDILINNAGIASKNHPVDPILEADEEDVLNVFRTNVLGTIRMTNALLPLMTLSQKKIVVNLSSDLGSIEKTFTAQSAKVKPGGVCSYRISKAAGNMASRIFAAELGDEAIVVAMSPGWVQTDMGSSGSRVAPLTPDQSIAGMLDVITKLSPCDSGKFYSFNGSEVPF